MSIAPIPRHPTLQLREAKPGWRRLLESLGWWLLPKGTAGQQGTRQRPVWQGCPMTSPALPGAHELCHRKTDLTTVGSTQGHRELPFAPERPVTHTPASPSLPALCLLQQASHKTSSSGSLFPRSLQITSSHGAPEDILGQGGPGLREAKLA